MRFKVGDIVNDPVHDAILQIKEVKDGRYLLTIIRDTPDQEWIRTTDEGETPWWTCGGLDDNCSPIPAFNTPLGKVIYGEV